MTRDDMRLFSTALAFVAVVTNGQTIKPHETTEKTLGLAKQIRDFCSLHAAPASAVETIVLTDEPEAAFIDQAIERHIKALRDEEVTELPADRATLLKFYDRLQQRKARRMNRVLYGTVSDDRLADLILRYLDEEISDVESLS